MALPDDIDRWHGSVVESSVLRHGRRAGGAQVIVVTRLKLHLKIITNIRHGSMELAPFQIVTDKTSVRSQRARDGLDECPLFRQETSQASW